MIPLFAALTSMLSISIDPPPDCKPADIVKVLSKDTPFAIVSGTDLVATDGKLVRVTCGFEAGPRTQDIRVDPNIDFRANVPLGDGRLVVGGTGGLVIVDPKTGKSEALTDAPPYPADRCWAGADDQHPVPGWDRSPRVGARGADGKPTSIFFERGGPCGYEREATRTSMVVDLATRAARPARAVAAMLVARSNVVLLADGATSGGCQETQTRGTLWLSLWGAPFAPLPIDLAEYMGFVALGETKDGSIWALSGMCQNGGASLGGNLWRAERGGQWERLEVPFQKDELGADVGQAILALVVRGAEVHVARARTDDKHLSWQLSRNGGRTWKAERRAPKVAMKVPPKLAAELGVTQVFGVFLAAGTTWAYTSDGAFSRVKVDGRDGPWVRRFPPSP